jgi:hypothetical protein
LSDPSKQSEFTSLLSTPSSSTLTFLTGLATLYRLLLRIEFSAALFDLALPIDSFTHSHARWLAVLKYAHSSPLHPFVSEWLSTHAIDVDDDRQRMKDENSVESLSAHRGRMSCEMCLANQPSKGSDQHAHRSPTVRTAVTCNSRQWLFLCDDRVHPACAALRSQLA